jgi:GntR family transcriptional regulator
MRTAITRIGQLRDHIVGLILDSVLNDGDPLPSVRTVAAEFRVNPITVLKAYQELADEQLVEKKRGLGMFEAELFRDPPRSRKEKR